MNAEPKKCVVRYIPTGELLQYHEDIKYLTAHQPFTVFPSKHKANVAMHHTVEHIKNSTGGEPWKDYEVLEIKVGKQ